MQIYLIAAVKQLFCLINNLQLSVESRSIYSELSLILLIVEGPMLHIHIFIHSFLSHPFIFSLISHFNFFLFLGTILVLFPLLF